MRRPPSNRPARWAAIGALVLVLAVVAIARRVSTETTPPLVLHRALAAYVRVPGRAPALAWPREGQAAAEVEGVGGLGGSGGSTPVPIASVAKVMTAYLTLLEHPLAASEQGFVMTITPAEVEEQGDRTALGESTVPVREGERLTERQALQALLLPSANNIAAALADYDAGSLRAFVAGMNSAALKLGMTSTTYTDPSGFEESTVSTAADQLKLARAAMQLPVFATIVAEPSAVLPIAGRVSNLDALIGAEGYVGIKTGSDSAAGGCLMFAKRVTIAGRRLMVLGVVLGQHEGELVEAALVSAQRLGNSVAAALHMATVLPAGTTVLSASNASGGTTHAVTAAPLREVGWGGAQLRVLVIEHGSITRLAAGERVARVAVLSGTSAVSTAAAARDALGGPSLGWRLRHLL
jgi:D-alanyl-D-alanine carboxypeptidase (penicillin-binding protein 5/6)